MRHVILSSVVFRSRGMRVVVCAVIAIAAMPAVRAQWNGASTGVTIDAAHTYTDPANWVSGTINDSFAGFTFTGNTSLYFPVDHATAGDVNTVWNTDGTNRTITFTTPSTGGDVTYTLNGSWTHGSSATNVGSPLTFNGSNAARKLILDLAGATRTFNVDSDGFTVGANTDISDGGITKTGSASLTIQAPVTASGTFTVQGGTLRFESAGGAANVTNFVIDRVSGSPTLTLGLVAGGNKFNDQAAVSLAGSPAQFQTFNGSANAAATEAIGTIRLVQGYSAIRQEITNTGNSITLTASALDRLSRSTSMLRYNDNARPIGGAANRIFVAETPTQIGGDGSRGTNLPVVPYLVSATTNSNTANTFVTYDATNGFRPLTSADVVTTFAAANADGNDNVILAANEGVTSSLAINSFSSSFGFSSISISAGQTLTVKSGVWIANAVGTTGAGTLSFGTSEGIIYHVGGSAMTFSSAIAGSNGLTINTGGSVAFSGANTFTGQTTLTGGDGIFQNSTAGANNSLPDDGTVLLHRGARATIGTTNAAVGRTDEVVGGVAGLGAIRLGNGSSASANRGKLLIGGSLGSGAAGEFTLAGGTIAPGLIDSGEIGTLSFAVSGDTSATANALRMLSGTLAIDVAAGGINDLVSVAGDTFLNRSGGLGLSLDFGSFLPSVNDTWTILVAGGESGVNTVTNLAVGDLFDSITSNLAGAAFTTQIADYGTGTKNAITVTLVAVPEPAGSPWAGVAVALGGLVAWRRRAGQRFIRRSHPGRC